MGNLGFFLLRLANTAYNVMTIIIFVSCIISWIPNVNRYKEPIKSIMKISDSILDPIRDFLVKRGVYMPVDISPIIAIFLMRIVLQILYMIF